MKAKIDIAENLNYTFEEQCSLQIENLRKELVEQRLDERRYRHWRGSRLFYENIFDEIGPQIRQNRETQLCYTLKSLGEHIKNNFTRAIRKSKSDENLDNEIPQSPETAAAQWPPNTLLTIDRKIHSNYDYDENGVIYLKPKEGVRFNAGKLTRQAIILHIVAKVLKLLEDNNFMTKRELYYKSLEYCRIGLSKASLSSQSQRSSGNGTQSTSQAAGNSQAASMSQAQGSLRSTLTNTSQRCNSQHDGHIRERRFNVERYNPNKLETAIDDLCCLIGCSRVHLHILTQSKGIVYGDLKFTTRTGEVYDCLSRRSGISIPTPEEPIVQIRSDAKFILLLEKDSVMQKILIQEDTTNFIRDHKIIVFTAKGYPDVTSRAFLNYLWNKLKIPILALTDADPHGFEIVCSFKFGCYTTAYEGPTLAVPQIRWLGLLPGDILRLSVPDHQTLPHTSMDLRKISSLLSRPYITNKTAWLQQLELMRDSGRKAELESLDSSGEYLVRTYLPNKLRYASWI